MPELPEVETVRRGLETHLIDLSIIDSTVNYPPIVDHQQEALSALWPQKITAIKRMGKYLIFILTDVSLVIHLRMEGKFYIKSNEPVNKHEHVLFHLSNGLQLRYHDVRKFGRILIKDKTHYLEEKPLNQLALEPVDMPLERFYKATKGRHQAIKTVCLDQHVIAGLGNIYVDETLFLSNIHPEKKANELTKTQAEKILKNAKEVLAFATALGGSTIRSYQSSLGIHGRFQNELRIHMRQNQPCVNCQTLIQKIRVGGRGTYVCPNCQKK
ncbi:MAG: DNA-formamidopyrimidine glycosylase [Acholeplasmataceae bacterium]